MSNPFSLALTLYSSSADYTYPPPKKKVISNTLKWHRRVIDVSTPRISCGGGFLLGR